MTHITRVPTIAQDDAQSLQVSEREYGSSWKQRGGVGAFMMLARKWDRIENALRPSKDDKSRAAGYPDVATWDVLGALHSDSREEGILDDIRDLRRYLMLVEAEYLETRKLAPDTEMENMRKFNERLDAGPAGYPHSIDSPSVFIDYTKETIPYGSREGHCVSVLYSPAGAGHWEMMAKHIDEYGV